MGRHRILQTLQRNQTDSAHSPFNLRRPNRTSRLEKPLPVVSNPPSRKKLESEILGHLKDIFGRFKRNVKVAWSLLRDEIASKMERLFSATHVREVLHNLVLAGRLAQRKNCYRFPKRKELPATLDELMPQAA